MNRSIHLQYLLLLFCLIISRPSNGQVTLSVDNYDVSTRKYENGNTFQKDAILFYAMLEETHPYYSQNSLRQTARKSYRALKNCKSNKEFKHILQSSICELNDSHTMIDYEYAMDSLFPLQLDFVRDSAYISAISTHHSELLGCRVISINNLTISDLLARSDIILSNENIDRLYYLIAQQMQFQEFWDYIGTNSDSLVVELENKTKHVIVPEKRSDLRVVATNPYDPNTTPKKALYYYDFRNDSTICYFQFNAFMDRLTNDNANLPRFDDFIYQMFEKIQSSGTKLLVVDLQYNKGGNSILGDILLSYLKPVEDICKYNVSFRYSSLLESTYPYYKNICTNLGERLEYGKMYGLSDINSNESYIDVYKYNKDPELVFDGKVVFIMGDMSYSSAGLLLTTAYDNNIGTVIGVPSTFSPNSYGDILFWRLPHTGVKGYVSFKSFTRPDMRAEPSNNLFPDIYVNDMNNVWKIIQDHYDKF